MIMIVIDVETAFLGGCTTCHFYSLFLKKIFFKLFMLNSIPSHLIIFFLWIVTLEEEWNFFTFTRKCLQQTAAPGKGEGAGEM